MVSAPEAVSFSFKIWDNMFNHIVLISTECIGLYFKFDSAKPLSEILSYGKVGICKIFLIPFLNFFTQDFSAFFLFPRSGSPVVIHFGFRLPFSS